MLQRAPLPFSAIALALVACTDPAARAERERAEEADRDARRAKAKSIVCTDEIEAELQPVVFRFAENEETDNLAVVYVQPGPWAALNVDEKTIFAGWAALCVRGKDMLSLRDGNSGDTLTTWSLDGGLR